ncbi:hypothetical protein M408DRAFT_213654 [Serendipita vermifera MAFF 305830]|uniref:Uncharacterized protein n=1 Tax=Serendipita vermifera MAFF 305830 TaxID=933852 RepID=A0A0C2XTA7_SERVB|nr:hypothetical protein M408DRAFT_130166 [Serendipita vermifera MAFF 305830]KIM32097.1 hypothetical protein M408DRAFT_213654 [Serendipita vermifera MAFF 305830]
MEKWVVRCLRSPGKRCPMCFTGTFRSPVFLSLSTLNCGLGAYISFTPTALLHPSKRLKNEIVISKRLVNKIGLIITISHCSSG